MAGIFTIRFAWYCPSFFFFFFPLWKTAHSGRGEGKSWEEEEGVEEGREETTYYGDIRMNRLHAVNKLQQGKIHTWIPRRGLNILILLLLLQ